MCHKYRQIGRIDEKGRKRSYYVNEYLYANSVHRNVPCRDCHTYITRIPHDPVTEGVNCGNQCHIKLPFSKENFSHKKIVDLYNESAHGIKEDDPPELKEAKPKCKYCHTNPLYKKVSAERISPESVKRCMICHQKQGVSKAYKHVTHRLRYRYVRPPQEIVQLCSKNCHANEELMSKFKVSKVALKAVETYKESLHGKSVTLGSQNSPDCLSCHASNLHHDIYKKDDPRSTINDKNRVETCKQCHKNANEGFVKADVHPEIDKHEKPVIYAIYKIMGFVSLGAISSLVGLMLLETYGRKQDGIKWQLRRGTTWRGKSKRKF